MGVHFEHDYPNASIRTITISGDNITGLQECRSITSLDVSRCVELTKLSFIQSPITSLDVSKNTVLKEFWGGGTLLTSLDFSKNTVLSNMACFGNFTATALNALFRTLHGNDVGVEKQIIIGSITREGEAECDRSIAERKGWTFRQY